MKQKLLKVALSSILCISTLAAALPVQAEEAPSTIPAFPGAEGAGKFTSGGRGYDVYEVTNLNDSGPGSLRDAISSSNRMVVFRVSGTIQLKSSLSFSNRKNITVAGQSAPGDGITLAGHGTEIGGAENIIIRYLRFRPGSENIAKEPDALGGRGSNYIMIDHVSASWGTDEALSMYENRNSTVQWSIISESLTLSGHYKGRHGYGGIWGGISTTFHHNLLATHTSRNPRIGNGNTPGNITISNNVIYNWGFNSTYGGTLNNQANVVNNYYKPGPSTFEGVKERIINPNIGDFYVNGNYMFGSPAVSADNSKGVQDIGPEAFLADAPYQNDSYANLNIESAETAYHAVLNRAGAVLPKRDAVDARVVRDVLTGEGRMINREYEVGGFPELKSAEAPLDSDHDGIPDVWEDAHGLDKNNAADGKAITASGYSNLEIYLNSLADMSYVPENPVVKLTTPVYNGLYNVGSPIQVKAEASDADGIAKVEFYLNDTLAGTVTQAPYHFTMNDLEDGTYFISARAYDNKGNATQSTSMPVHVNGPKVGAPWNSVDIGNTPVQGNASVDGSGNWIIKGSGKITGKADSFHYVYQPIHGNGVLTAKLDSLYLLDNNAISGLMIRESLAPDAAEAFISTSIVKADRDENGNGTDDDTFYATYFSSREKKGDVVQTLNNSDYPQDYLPAVVDINLPIWLKIERMDNVIVAFTSADGATWTELSRKTIAMNEEAYIGFAVDGTQPKMQNKYYNTAKFSNVKLSQSFSVTSAKLTDVFGNELSGSLTPGANAIASVEVKNNSSAIKDAVICVQLLDANDQVMGTSYVDATFLTGQPKTIKAGFSTPRNLPGLKVKAFVTNNVNEGMLISNEIIVQ